MPPSGRCSCEAVPRVERDRSASAIWSADRRPARGCGWSPPAVRRVLLLPLDHRVLDRHLLRVGLELDAEVERRVAVRQLVAHVVGQVALGQLPRLLAAPWRRRPHDVLHRLARAEAVRRRAPVRDVQVAGRVRLGGGADARAARGCVTKYVTRRSPPASLACSSSRNSARSRRHHHRMAVQHEVLLGRPRRQVHARTPSTLIDMPRMSRSRSAPTSALANRMCPVIGARRGEQADPLVGGQPVGHRELGVDARRWPAPG